MVPRCIVFAIFVPTRSPIGVIESSAPSVKSIIPAINSTAPNKNKSRMLAGTGVIVKLSSTTIAIIGDTAFSDSFNFSVNLVR